MQKTYPHLFSPITIGNQTFKNRIWTAPATPHMLQAHETYPTEQIIDYYAAKARGGSACVTFASIVLDTNAPCDTHHADYNLLDPMGQRYWYQLASAIHYYGAKASIEFLGFVYHGYDKHGDLVAFTPNSITNEEMDRIAEDYADNADAARKCGFDVIFIHAGHGLFFGQMMSPLFNKRTDEFGGSFENRCKFLSMVLDRIRKRVGNEVLVELRISGSELIDGGLNHDDCIRLIEMTHKKIDIVHISCGTLLVDSTIGIMHPTGFLKPGCNVYHAKEVREELHKKGITIPVLTLGALQQPELMENIIRNGEADLVSMARGTIADPDMPVKALEGREDEIIPCIKCFHCLDYTRAPEYNCSVNPTVGRELRLLRHIPPVSEKKKAVVIGGGPAGMQAAITAKQRGHDVTLYEKRKELGGKLLFSRKVNFKYDVRNFLEYQIHMVKKFGVTVKLNTEVTPEFISKQNADVVFAALGATAVRPSLPGVDSKNVMIAEEAYNNPSRLGDSVVIIGGGEVGCETALYLAQDHEKKVSLIEMTGRIAADAYYINRIAITERMDKLVSYYTDATCKGIDEKGIKYICNNQEKRIDADTVILAVGMKPERDAAEAFRCCAPVFWNIGDSLTAKNIRTCTRSAFDAASQM